MKIRVFDSHESLYDFAAQKVMAKIKSKPDLVLGLAAGHTPTPLYQRLIANYAKKNISFSGVTTFNLDEFCGISKDDPASFAAYIRATFSDNVDIDPQHVHSLDGAALDLVQECETYEKKILSCGGIDLQILGIGTNGHIAFNEPGSSFDSRTRVVTLTDSTRRANADSFGSRSAKLSDGHEVPKLALTMGLQTIYGAREILLLALGESKQNAVQMSIYGPQGVDFPASCLQTHPHCTICLDHLAAKK